MFELFGAATTSSVIVSEKQNKAAVEAEDAPSMGTPAHAEMLRRCGIRVDFLLALTFALNMWEWTTSDVVQHLVKIADTHCPDEVEAVRVCRTLRRGECEQRGT